MRVYLLRHGETDWNIERRLQGSVDTVLNATGIQQAKSWRPYLDGFRFAGIYSSGLNRAIHSAFLATNRPACIIPEFNERRFGQWEGQRWADLEIATPEFTERWNDNGFMPPGGESRQELFERVGAALSSTVHQHNPSDDVLIVAHGASGHAILSSLLGRPIEARGDLPPLINASLTLIEIQQTESVLRGQIDRPGL
jgi:probable phosphoglycerate mutase